MGVQGCTNVQVGTSLGYSVVNILLSFGDKLLRYYANDMLCMYVGLHLIALTC